MSILCGNLLSAALLLGELSALRDMRLKHVLIGLAGLVVVVVGGAAIAIYSIDFNAYRTTVADQVKQATGRDLKIAGDVKVGISLTPTVAVDNVTFANASWGSRPEMATVKRFEAEMELLPLLSGDIRVKRVVLKGADILLETDAKGQGNWTFGQAGAAQPATPSAGGPGKLPVVNKISFEDVTITYKNGVTKKTQTVALQKFSAESADAASPIALEIVANLNGNPVSATGIIGALSGIVANQPLPIDLKGEGGGATVAVKGTIAKPAAGKGIALALTAEGKSLADLTPLAGSPLPPLGPYSLSGNLSDAEGGYKIAGLQLKMGGSDVAGDASIAMILVTARPNFEYGFAGHPVVTRLMLNRLGRTQVTAIATRVSGGKPLPDAVLDEIAAKTDGVPLFVEEIAKAVLESGALREAEDAYVLARPLNALTIPATLHDSLMARLDRLRPIKEVAQIAAVIGRSFDHRTLAAIAPQTSSELSVALDSLVDAELVFRRGAPPDAHYLFKHALVRDAAYESLLKSRRQAVHELEDSTVMLCDFGFE